MLSTIKAPAYNPISAMQSNCYKNKNIIFPNTMIGFVLEVVKVLGRQCLQNVYNFNRSYQTVILHSYRVTQ